MERRADRDVVVVWVFSFDLLNIQIGDWRQSTTVVWSAYNILAKCKMVD